MRRYQLVPPPGGLSALVDELARAAEEAVPGSEADARRVGEVLFAGRVRQDGSTAFAELGPPVLLDAARPPARQPTLLLVDIDARDLPFLFAAVLVDELGGRERAARERRFQALFTAVVGPRLFEQQGRRSVIFPRPARPEAS